MGTASIPEWVVPKDERTQAADLAARIEESNEWVRESFGDKIERLDASICEMQDNEKARRLDYGAVATAADRIEGAAKELRAKIEAWTTTLVLSTATTAGRAEREAKRVAKQARDAIAGLDLARLLEREADGEKTNIGRRRGTQGRGRDPDHHQLASNRPDRRCGQGAAQVLPAGHEEDRRTHEERRGRRPDPGGRNGARGPGVGARELRQGDLIPDPARRRACTQENLDELPRRTDPGAGPRRARRSGPLGARARRRGHGQDPGPHQPHRVPHRERDARAPHPRRHLHQPRRARAHEPARADLPRHGRRGLGAPDRHLPRHCRQVASQQRRPRLRDHRADLPEHVLGHGRERAQEGPEGRRERPPRGRLQGRAREGGCRDHARRPRPPRVRRSRSPPARRGVRTARGDVPVPDPQERRDHRASRRRSAARVREVEAQQRDVRLQRPAPAHRRHPGEKPGHETGLRRHTRR